MLKCNTLRYSENRDAPVSTVGGIILYYRMESQLIDFEYRVGVKQRWKKTDKDYIAAQRATLLNKKEALHSSLRAAVVRRHYLLNLKAKYAGQRRI